MALAIPASNATAEVVSLEMRLHALQYLAAQTRVLAEIRTDLTRPHPMQRLLQGDVGSGKTIVAALAALQAIESGYQATVMAPTEILAEQHYRREERRARRLRDGQVRAAFVPRFDVGSRKHHLTV